MIDFKRFSHRVWLTIVICWAVVLFWEFTKQPELSMKSRINYFLFMYCFYFLIVVITSKTKNITKLVFFYIPDLVKWINKKIDKLDL